MSNGTETRYMVVAYPKNEKSGDPAVAWGKINGKDAWVPLSGEIVKVGVNSAVVTLMSGGAASDVRENARRFAQRPTYEYLIVAAKDWAKAAEQGQDKDSK